MNDWLGVFPLHRPLHEMTITQGDEAGSIVALRELLQSIVPLPDLEWAWLRTQIEPRFFGAGAALFRPGSNDAGLHFLVAGLVRYFYSSEDGEERNHTFAAEGNLVACLPALIGTGPCTFTVQALEDTETLLICGEAVQEFADRHPCWLKLRMRLMEHVAQRKAAREAEFLQCSAEMRYRRFQENLWGARRPHSSVSHRLLSRHYAGGAKPDTRAH
jgi:CRP-like cAMP-binding protein